LVESAMPSSELTISNTMVMAAQVAPVQSGYADSMGNGAVMAAMGDMTHLFARISMTSLWITPLHGALPKAALDTDLTIDACSGQAQVPNLLQATMHTGSPSCPCGMGGSGGAGGSSSVGAGAAGGSGGSVTIHDGGCGVGGRGSAPAPALVVLGALALH